MRRLTGLAALALLLSLAGSARAEPVELAHDDGVPGGVVLGLVPGDAEAVRFTAEHPTTLLTLRLYFGAAARDATVLILGDFGGSEPDFDSVLWSGVITPVEDDWTEVDLGGDGVEIAPLTSFYVVHLVDDASTLLAWDGSGSDVAHSLVRMADEWYFIGDGGEPARPVDALVRVGAELHDVVETRWFSDATEALGTSGMGRMAWGDYDGDGDDDLLVDGNRLYRNRGDGTFEDVSVAAGIAGRPTSGGVWADYDNDGNLDFYATVHNYLPACDAERPCAADGFVCDGGQCRAEGQTTERDHDILWRGNGDGTFTDVSESAGRPYDYLPSEGAAWGDMDGDGFVDLYVANYETPTNWTGGELSRGTEDYLWRNRGDGTFEDVSERSGIRVYRPARCGRGVAWVDYDDDGWPDLYVANYRLQFNYLWRNLGFGAFENVSFDVGVAGVEVNNAFGHSIGAAWADLDNDGDWDLIVANLAHPRFIEFSNKTSVYLSSGGGQPTFTDVFATSGITYYETHSDPALGDFDNDGLVDLFVTGVYVGYRSFLYRNLGSATFADVTYAAGTRVDNGWGVAWADYDGDGDLDLASRSLYRNDRTDLGHFLELRLVGVLSNRSAIGARVKVTAGGQTMMRQVEGGKGTTTQSSLTLHFGLGAATVADEVVIDWPTFPAYQERFTAVRADRIATYVEGSGEVIDAGAPDAAPTADASGAPPGGSGDGCGCAAAPERPPVVLLLLLLAALARCWRRRGRGGGRATSASRPRPSRARARARARGPRRRTPPTR